MFIYLWKLIAIIVTGGHPEKLDRNKIGSRKTDFVVYGVVVLLTAVLVIVYIAHHKTT